jgi:hypothetical protein
MPISAISQYWETFCQQISELVLVGNARNLSAIVEFGINGLSALTLALGINMHGCGYG